MASNGEKTLSFTVSSGHASLGGQKRTRNVKYCSSGFERMARNVARTLLMDDEEQVSEWGERRSFLRSDVAAREVLPGPNQKLPLLKAGDHSRAPPKEPIRGEREGPSKDGGRAGALMARVMISFNTQTQIPPLILTPSPTSLWPWPCRQHIHTHTLFLPHTHTHTHHG